MSDKALKLKRMMELVAQKELRNKRPMPSINIDEGRTIANEAIGETFDDFMMATEMLVDEYYGKVDLQAFKKQWYNISAKYDGQLRNLIKDMTKGQPQQGI